MKKNIFLLVIILVLAPLAYAFYMYPNLPETIPTHYGVNGADQWGSKENVFLIPGIMGLVSIVVFLLMSNLKRIDPKRYAKTDNEVFSQFGLFIVAFLSCLSMIILYKTNQDKIPIEKIMLPGLGLFFSGIGFFLPKLKQNYFAGFRLPWTLESEANWDATHLYAGKILKWGGLIQLFSGVLFEGKMLIVAFVAITIVMVALPIIFSYRMFRDGMK